MTRYPTTRAEAEHDIEQLYGWSNPHYGRLSQATDDEVIAIACDMRDHDDSCFNNPRPYEHKELP